MTSSTDNVWLSKRKRNDNVCAIYTSLIDEEEAARKRLKNYIDQQEECIRLHRSTFNYDILQRDHEKQVNAERLSMLPTAIVRPSTVLPITHVADDDSWVDESDTEDSSEYDVESSVVVLSDYDSDNTTNYVASPVVAVNDDEVEWSDLDI